MSPGAIARTANCPACNAWPWIGSHGAGGCGSLHGGSTKCGCRYEDPAGLMPGADFCATKQGSDNRVCGKVVVYLTTKHTSVEGWYHLHAGDYGHHAVPKREVR